ETDRRLLLLRAALTHVRPPVPLGVGVRLVAGVDDRPRAGGRAGDPLPDVLGALGDAVDRAARGGGDVAGAADDLPADEERDQHVRQPLELAVAAGRVGLVAGGREYV